MFCYKCGSESQENAAFCHKCGTQLIVNNTSAQTGAMPVAQHTTISNTEPSTESTAYYKESYTGTVTNDPPSKIDAGIVAQLASYCTCLGVLRFIDAALWLVIIVIQLEYAETMNTILNLVTVGVTIYLAVNLLPGKFVDQYEMTGGIDSKRIANFIGYNGGLSVLSIFFYVYQYYEYDIPILIPVIILEAAIAFISGLVYVKFRPILSRKKT